MVTDSIKTSSGKRRNNINRFELKLALMKALSKDEHLKIGEIDFIQIIILWFYLQKCQIQTDLIQWKQKTHFIK